MPKPRPTPSTPTTTLWLRKSHSTCRLRRADGLENADLARFLDHKGNLAINDAEGGHDHDEEQQVEHHFFFGRQRVENE